MEKHFSLSFAGPPKTRSISGGEKFTFLYVAGSALALTCGVAYSLMAGLTRLQSILLLIGCVLVAGAAVFCLLEVVGIARRGKPGAPKAQPDVYASRTVAIEPPTGDPYAHHEDYKESAGLDQGQLTARIPGSTPFIGDLLERGQKRQRS